MCFSNALNEISFFTQKPKQPRGQPFQLELNDGFSVPLQMFVKISVEKFVPKLDMKSSDDVDIAKIRQYEQSNVQVKNENGETESGPVVVVDKEDVIKGYHYGTSIIPFSKADKELSKVNKEGKQLQLIMFTKSENASFIEIP